MFFSELYIEEGLEVGIKLKIRGSMTEREKEIFDSFIKALYIPKGLEENKWTFLDKMLEYLKKKEIVKYVRHELKSNVITYMSIYIDYYELLNNL